MRQYFGTQITSLLTFTVEPIYTNAGDLAIAIGFTWADLDGFAQYHGYGAWEAQDGLVAKVDAILRDKMPWYIEGSLFDCVADEKGEQWITPVPARKHITADFIDVV